MAKVIGSFLPPTLVTVSCLPDFGSAPLVGFAGALDFFIRVKLKKLKKMFTTIKCRTIFDEKLPRINSAITFGTQ